MRTGTILVAATGLAAFALFGRPGQHAAQAQPAIAPAAKAETPPAAASDNIVLTKGRILTPAGKRIYVSLYSTDAGHNRDFLFNYATVNIVPELKRVPGIGSATTLGRRGSTMLIRLKPDRLRANDVSAEDVMMAFEGCSMLGSAGRPAKATEKTSEENVLTHVAGRYNKPEQFENIILKANAEGDVLRLKDVAEIEPGPPLAEIESDVDGHPSAAVVVKTAPGSSAAEVVADVKKKLAEIEEESFPPGMACAVTALESPGVIYAVVEPARDATLDQTSTRCHELAAIAQATGDVTSVWSLSGYQIRTERHDPHAGTCLVQLKERSDRPQTIEKLAEKCRAMQVHVEFFEPPAAAVFVAAGGFAVRVLDQTNSGDKRSAAAEKSLDDLLNRQDLRGLLSFLASNYPQHELIINNDLARQKGVSLASALANLPLAVGSDDQGRRKFWRLAEDLPNLSVKNDRGERVPYASFIELKQQPGLNESR